jgi:ketosteroid isomerase-like protein
VLDAGPGVMPIVWRQDHVQSPHLPEVTVNNAPWLAVLASFTLLGAAACAPKPAPIDTSADVAALRAAQDHEAAMISSGNVDSALTPYTSDVVMMPPNEPAINGTAALRTWFEALLKDNSASPRYTGFEADVSGDLAVVRYTGELTVTPKKGGAAMTETVKGIHVYKRQADGSWKIAQDVWNADAPSPPPPAKKD